MLRNCQETLSTPNHQKLRNFHSTGARPKFLIKKYVIVSTFAGRVTVHFSRSWVILSEFKTNLPPYCFFLFNLIAYQWEIVDQIRRSNDLALTSAAIHIVDLAAFTGFSQQFGLIIIRPLNLWEAPEHLYNRAGFCYGKFLKHTSGSLSKVKDLNLTPVNATLKASRNVLWYLRCSNNTNAQNCFAIIAWKCTH